MTAAQAGSANGSAVTDAYKGARGRLRGKAPAETPVKKAARERGVQIVKKAAEATSEKVVTALAGLKLQTAAALDTVGAQLTSEIEKLREVQEAIVVQTTALDTLYGITAEADNLQILILAQTEVKQEHDLLMKTAREGWNEEKANRAKGIETAALELATSRRREVEQYNYDTQKSRKASEDKWLTDMANMRITEDNARIERSKALDAREAVIKASEAELKTLREQVAKNEETLKSEVGKAVGMATNGLKRDLEHKHALETMAKDNELSVVRDRLAAAITQTAELSKRNTELDVKIAAASDKVQQIAEKAIEGASKQSTVLQLGNNEGAERGGGKR